MRNQKGYVAGYNGQAVVTAEQVIVGAMLSQHPVDRTLLHPLLDTCRQQLAAAGIRPKLRTVLADSGYVSEENFARADADKLRLLAPLAKDPGRRRAGAPPSGPGTWTSIRPPPAPSGACGIPAAGGLQAAGPHRGTGVRATQDLPETDHDVPPRPRRVRKRMAARLHRPQSAEAAPAPPDGLTVTRPACSSQRSQAAQDRKGAARTTSHDPPARLVGTALCEQAKDASAQRTQFGDTAAAIMTGW